MVHRLVLKMPWISLFYGLMLAVTVCERCIALKKARKSRELVTICCKNNGRYGQNNHAPVSCELKRVI